MLELTERTILAVKELTGRASPAAGLRIFAEPAAEGELELSAVLVEFPAEVDEVVEAEGARVYLDPEAAAALADEVLDTHVENGSVHLTLMPQD